MICCYADAADETNYLLVIGSATVVSGTFRRKEEGKALIVVDVAL